MRETKTWSRHMKKEQLIARLRENLYETLVEHLEIEGGSLTLDDVNTILEDVAFELYLDYGVDDDDEEGDFE